MEQNKWHLSKKSLQAAYADRWKCQCSGNLKKHEKICPGPKKLNVCQYFAKQFKFNYLGIRHEKKGCRDRPGLINIIVWIDSFFELRCCVAMSTFWRGRLSWWNSISFRTTRLNTMEAMQYMINIIYTYVLHKNTIHLAEGQVDP
jgi:hypothetical protein